MNEEEMKAIEELKEEISRPVEVPEDKFDTFILYNIENAKIILNLISKLQKENKKLKKQSEISAKTHIKNDDLKDKVIDKMAKTISGLALYDFNRKEYFILEDEGEVREYFYKKVEE